jgi:hypothetical protein
MHFECNFIIDARQSRVGSVQAARGRRLAVAHATD